MTRRSRLTVYRVALAILATLFLTGTARAQDHLCDPANEDCRDILIGKIRAEQVSIDVAFWFMEDPWYANELIAKWRSNIPVRIIVDSRANSTYHKNAPILQTLKDAGIPMRERFQSGILHWKMMLFSGQNLVQFSGANYSDDAWSPLAPPLYSNYVDEAILFSAKPSIVSSFRTKFDDLWTNETLYRNYANINGPLTRLHGPAGGDIDPELNFAPWEAYANRAVARYNAEPATGKIDSIIYRITDRRHTDAIIAAFQRGVPVRIISEPNQYRDPTRQWHSWNIDRMYMAGIPIRHRKHAGLNHQKSTILYGQHMTIFGSSNWSEASSDSQEEHNLFTHEDWIFNWFVDQFERKWNNTAPTGAEETQPFVPLPPDQPKNPFPLNGTTAVPETGVTLRWEGGWWAHVYDVYLGTSPNPPLHAANLSLWPSSWEGHQQYLELQAPLQPGTTYYWRIVGKTIANRSASSPTWSFTTAGTPPPPPPPVTVVRGPYLQQVTSTAATVVWATTTNGAGEVRASSNSGASQIASATTTFFPASATGMSADYYQHEARLTGLSPSTAYTYDILVGGVDANPQSDFLTTAPPTGSGTVSFVAFGDSGTGSSEQWQIASQIEVQPFDFMLHGGDVAYGDATGVGGATHTTLHNWFFAVYTNTLRSRPVFPSIGNHDSRASNNNGRPYLDMFALPRNGATGAYPDHAERYYSFDYGPVHVVVLDTELAFQDTNRRAAQLAWLDADLAATSQPWKIALFHRSPFSAGGEHGSDLTVRAEFAPIFERRGVQAVLSAHEHTYERTKPWRVTTGPGSPVTYIVTGGGGGPLYPAGTDTWTAASASRHHYVRGTATTCNLAIEAVGLDGSTFDSVSLNRCQTTPDTQAPTASITAPAGGSTVQGNVTVNATATDNVGVVRAELLVDGSMVSQDTAAPYSFTWNTASAANGSHQLVVRAVDAAGNAGHSAPVQVTLANPTAGAGDIVLYASDATVIAGAWRRVSEPTAAGGMAMHQPDAGVPKLSAALANPTHYFELPFTPEANVPYHLWVRIRPQNDYWANESVFIQFSNSTQYPIGTTSGADVNLEDCSGCGVQGWGWQDNAWGIGVQAQTITFATNAPRIMRVQTREDGAFVDQIILSPARFLTQSPGTLKNDTNIYPRTSGGTPPPTDTQAPVTSVTAPANGATISGNVTVNTTATDNVGVTRVELWVDGALSATDTSSPYSFAWNTEAFENGSHTLQSRAYDAAGLSGTSTIVTVTVNNGPPPDTQAPVTSITAPAAGATVGGTITVTASATDNVGVTRVELWVDGALSATDTSSPYSFSWNTAGFANGSHTLQSRAYDAAGSSGASAIVTVTVSNGPPPDTQSPVTSITAPAAGATVGGTATVTASATDNVGVTRVELWVDGALSATDTSAPYTFSWNTSGLTNGSHTLQSRAYDAAGRVGTSATVPVTVSNTTPTGPKEIVAYAADATLIAGAWRRVADPTAAGGFVMHHPDAGVYKLSSALANPTNYFELTVNVEANVPYHLWARLKPQDDYWANESVFIQFSGGSQYPIGTTTGADVNLEDCSGCGVQGWGWQDNAWGIGVQAQTITFSTGGAKTLRVQTREDGTYIDQIVLSPRTYLTTAPGPLKNDATILPKNP